MNELGHVVHETPHRWVVEFTIDGLPLSAHLAGVDPYCTESFLTIDLCTSPESAAIALDTLLALSAAVPGGHVRDGRQQLCGEVTCSGGVTATITREGDRFRWHDLRFADSGGHPLYEAELNVGPWEFGRVQYRQALRAAGEVFRHELEARGVSP